MLGIVAISGWHHDILVDAPIVGHHESNAAFQEEAPDYLLVLTLQHLHERRLAAPARIDARDAHHHAVAVQQAAHLPWREKQVIGSILRLEKSETIGVTHNTSAHEVGFVQQAVPAATISDYLPITFHRTQPALQCGQVLGLGHLQLCGDGLQGKRHPAVCQMLHDELATRNGALVLRRLPCRIWVSLLFPSSVHRDQFGSRTLDDSDTRHWTPCPPCPRPSHRVRFRGSAGHQTITIDNTQVCR